MKKIGIVTFHCAENYGAVLQAYALLSYTKSINSNYEVSVIDYNPKSITSTYSVFFPVVNNTSFHGRITAFIMCFLNLYSNIKKKNKFRTFRKNNLNIAKNWKNTNYDCVVCGSDQIWNPVLTDGIDPIYYACFCKNKVAYAVSDGGEGSFTDSDLSLVEAFTFLSVREKSFELRLRKALTNKKITTVLDPVFLLSKKEWVNKIKDIRIKQTNYILIYCLHYTKEFEMIKNELQEKLHKKIVLITYTRSYRQIFQENTINKVAVSPLEFLAYIYKADFILTNSFHGTAFSIIFNKNFFVPYLPKRAERITDMLHNFGLSNRYINKLPVSDQGFCIDYSLLIKNNISTEIERSKIYLRNSLLETLCI